MLVTVAVCFFFFNDTATTEIYTLSLHDALPILPGRRGRVAWDEYHQGFGKERSILGVLVGWLAGTPGGWALLQLVAVGLAGEIGRAHAWTPVTVKRRMASSAWKKKQTNRDPMLR